MTAWTRLWAFVLAGTAAGPVVAGGWEGLYTFAEVPHVEVALPEEAVCVREILDAQELYNIPNNLLLGIGLQEAGIRLGDLYTVWPWSVNAAGEGRIFDSRSAAIDWVRERRAQGVTSIDIGCMQVNLQWHPDAFEAFEAGFEPARNVEYAARFLRDLYYQTGDWELAAGSYHSFTPALRETYLTSLRQNVVSANANIEVFRQIAGTLGATAEEVVPVAAQGGILWSSGMSRVKQGGDGTRSLYSNRALLPVLPQFLKGE